jgi:hypothetical protein
MVSDARRSRATSVDVETRCRPFIESAFESYDYWVQETCHAYLCAASFTALYGIGPIRNSGSDDNHLICARPDATLSRIVGDTLSN